MTTAAAEVMSEQEIREKVATGLDARKLTGKRVLVIIPDGTRSGPVGMFFRIFHELLADRVRALDYLIGTWDEDTQNRIEGCGFHAVAEMAWRVDPSRPILPTVNENVDAGGGLFIDWILVNEAMKKHVIPASYKVHIPDERYRPPSDHRLVTAAIEM